MIGNFSGKKSINNRAVSPVIGVILIVAVTVALVALATVIVFDIGSDVSDTADATVQFDQDGDTVEAQIIRNENVAEFTLQAPDGSTDEASDVGETMSLEAEEGTYSVIAELESGETEVLTSTDVDMGSEENGETVSGQATVNPEIEEATVEAYNAEGELVAYDITDSDGEYELVVNDVEDVQIVLSAEGETEVNNDNPLYAGATQDGAETVDFEFDEDELETVEVGGEDVYVIQGLDGSDTDSIYNVAHLQLINEDLDGDYELQRNIDASETYEWSDSFTPIGDDDEFGDRDEDEFTGSFDGQDYEVDGLTIDRSDEGFVGLFGSVDEEGVVENVGVTNADVKGEVAVGGLVGYNDAGDVSESYVTGDVEGDFDVGGLVGFNDDGDVSESYSTGDVDGVEVVGGLVGFNDDGDVSESYSTGDVKGEVAVGGLVGLGDDVVESSYWDTEVTGQDDSDAGTGLNTDEMTGDSATDNMSGFDFESTWVTVEEDYPALQQEE